MSLRSLVAFTAGKLASSLSNTFNLGAGITWCGEVALRIDPSFLSTIRKKVDTVIIVAGTNGKTTTSSMIAHILKKSGHSVIHNASGANLKNGIAGTFITQLSQTKNGKKCVALFEVDEAEFKNIVPILFPDVIVLLNLFRDQLDRYGEVDAIMSEWNGTLIDLANDEKHDLSVITNADDPATSFAAYDTPLKKVYYFGLSGTKTEQLNKSQDNWADSLYCLMCGNKLSYKQMFFSHLGDWSCSQCGIERWKPDVSGGSIPLQLKGFYNQYNAAAAFLTAKTIGINVTKEDLKDFKPAFGRQEEFTIENKKVIMYLSKNPTGFNESIRTIVEQNNSDTVILALNDRIPDGTDVSWIWDVDVSPLEKFSNIIVTGDRVWDMALRMKYSLKQKSNGTMKQWNNVTIEENLKEAIARGLEKTDLKSTLYILPTYSAMLDIRNILVGRKIL